METVWSVLDAASGRIAPSACRAPPSHGVRLPLAGNRSRNHPHSGLIACDRADAGAPRTRAIGRARNAGRRFPAVAIEPTPAPFPLLTQNILRHRAFRPGGTCRCAAALTHRLSVL